MDTIELICGVCGVPVDKHQGMGHKFAVRDDQLRAPTDRSTHYAIVEHRAIGIAQPLPGVDVVATVPATTRWRVQCLQAQLTTSVIAANRVVHLVITDGQGNQVYNFPAPGNHIAATTVQYSAAPESIQASFDNATVLCLPEPTHLLQGWTIGFSTTAKDAGDQWSKFNLIVKEWLNF